MKENMVDTVVDARPQKSYTEKLFMFTLLFTYCITALILGYIHYKYVSQLFDNDRNFSYLSNLEREMSLRTEMGFYYSYYKTVVEERPFLAALSHIMHDKRVEYPTEVNAFNRFCIHPEVMIGAIYQYFEPWINTTTHRVCHIVDRGSMSPVESCNGIGEPIVFYLNTIWILAGFTVSALFLHAITLSDSLLGGLLSVAQYFGNHAECTRVMWAPNERENLALPLLLLQSWLLTLQLRDVGRKATLQLQVAIFIVNCLCLLFWQFTQFIFLTQLLIFFIMEQINIIDVKTLCIILHSHFCGLHLAVLILQGNDMLKSSLYTSFFIILAIQCLFLSNIRIKVQNARDFCLEAGFMVLRVFIICFSSLYFKSCISEMLDTKDDSHVFHLLYAKFTDYKDFHTLIYTCSDVFDFLPWKSVINMSKTFLIPFALISSVNMCINWVGSAMDKCKGNEKEREDTEREDTDDSGIENNSESTGRKKFKKNLKNKVTIANDKFMCFVKSLEIDPSVFYNISQMVVYGIMAILFMRLKLLFATQMCIVTSLLMKFNTYRFPKWLNKYIPMVLLASTVPVFLYNMRANILKEMSHMGEFSDPAQEQLLNWIINATSPRASFAGSMPALAAVMLTTRRPIVAHPHYENSGARMRAYTVYGVYGRFSSEEVYTSLNKLQASYLIVEKKYCYGKSNKGCTFLDIWDIESPGHKTEPSLCHTLLQGNVDHFYPVFSNQEYTVFKLHDISVRYMPRSFDT